MGEEDYSKWWRFCANIWQDICLSLAHASSYFGYKHHQFEQSSSAVWLNRIVYWRLKSEDKTKHSRTPLRQSGWGHQNSFFFTLFTEVYLKRTEIQKLAPLLNIDWSCRLAVVAWSNIPVRLIFISVTTDTTHAWTCQEGTWVAVPLNNCLTGNNLFTTTLAIFSTFDDTRQV